MYVCMYVCMHICMYVCHIYMYMYWTLTILLLTVREVTLKLTYSFQRSTLRDRRKWSLSQTFGTPMVSEYYTHAYMCIVLLAKKLQWNLSMMVSLGLKLSGHTCNREVAVSTRFMIMYGALPLSAWTRQLPNAQWPLYTGSTVVDKLLVMVCINSSLKVTYTQTMIIIYM